MKKQPKSLVSPVGRGAVTQRGSTWSSGGKEGSICAREVRKVEVVEEVVGEGAKKRVPAVICEDVSVAPVGGEVMGKDVRW